MTRYGMSVKILEQNSQPGAAAQSMSARFKEDKIVSTVRWEAVCRCCGKRSEVKSLSDTQGRPNRAPLPPSGKCPSSSDGKHKPQWQKA